MENPRLVRRDERRPDLLPEPEGLIDAEGPVGSEKRGQVRPVDPVHDHERGCPVDEEVVDPDDIGMAKGPDRLDFAPEPLGRFLGGVRRRGQDLEGDVRSDPVVAGRVDDGVPAPAEFAEDFESIEQAVPGRQEAHRPIRSSVATALERHPSSA